MSSSVNRSACGNQYEQGYFRLETHASLSGILKYDHQFNDPTRDYFRISCTCRFGAEKSQSILVFFSFPGQRTLVLFITARRQFTQLMRQEFHNFRTMVVIL